jgi:hypothetical protein
VLSRLAGIPRATCASRRTRNSGLARQHEAFNRGALP